MRHLDADAAPPGIARDVGRGLESGLRRVGTGKDRHDSGRLRCLAGFERDDLGVGAVGAEEMAVQLAGQVPVEGVLPLPCDQPEILSPALEYRSHRRVPGKRAPKRSGTPRRSNKWIRS